VKLYGGGGEPLLTAHFGEFNPEGYLQYMRIDGNRGSNHSGNDCLRWCWGDVHISVSSFCYPD
jgi:hypothetical protein